MKKIIAAIMGFIACQILTICILTNTNVNSDKEEVDMEIYEFEYTGHEYLIFEKDGKYISVIHSPSCKCNYQSK